MLGTDDSPASIPLEARLQDMVAHGAEEPLRADAQRTVLKHRLHGLSHVMLFYRSEHGAYPPDLTTLEDWKDSSGRSALGEHGLPSFNVGEQKVQYVIPKSDDGRLTG